MTLRDEDKIIHSIVRWLAGARPKNGRRYYFEKYGRVAEKVKERLGRFRFSKVCPYCGKNFRRSNSLMVHLLLKHRGELKAMIEEGVSLVP